MPKKAKRQTRALQGPRTFSAMMPSYQGMHDGGPNGWTTRGDKSIPIHGQGWVANGLYSIYYETYIDLSALELDDLTLMPIKVGLQDPGFYTESPGTKEMVVMDVISQQRLDANTMENFMSPALNEYNNAPGMPGTDIDYHMITMGNLRIMYLSSQVTTTSRIKPFITQFSSPFGSGEPVVTQKLWCYRFIYYEGDADQTMEIPASRFILQGEVVDEKQYVYIQRLKQSYELKEFT